MGHLVTSNSSSNCQLPTYLSIYLHPEWPSGIEELLNSPRKEIAPSVTLHAFMETQETRFDCGCFSTFMSCQTGAPTNIAFPVPAISRLLVISIICVSNLFGAFLLTYISKDPKMFRAIELEENKVHKDTWYMFLRLGSSPQLRPLSVPGTRAAVVRGVKCQTLSLLLTPTTRSRVENNLAWVTSLKLSL